jgi:hypothetical protein
MAVVTPVYNGYGIWNGGDALSQLTFVEGGKVVFL